MRECISNESPQYRSVQPSTERCRTEAPVHRNPEALPASARSLHPTEGASRSATFNLAPPVGRTEPKVLCYVSMWLYAPSCDCACWCPNVVEGLVMSSCIDRVIGESDSCLPVIGIPCLPVTDLTFLSRLARDPSFLTSLLTDRVNGRALARTHLAHTWNPCPSKRMSRLFLRSRCASLEPAHPKPPSFYPQAVLYPNSQAPFTLVTQPVMFPLTACSLHSRSLLPLTACSLHSHCSLARCTRFAHLLLPFASLTRCYHPTRFARVCTHMFPTHPHLTTSVMFPYRRLTKPTYVYR